MEVASELNSEWIKAEKSFDMHACKKKIITDVKGDFDEIWEKRRPEEKTSVSFSKKENHEQNVDGNVNSKDHSEASQMKMRNMLLEAEGKVILYI